VILVGDVLVALSDAGELVLVSAEPDAYRELARADVLAGKCWSTPAFSDGALYLRSTREAVKVDLSGKGE
jgi:outer membrane protein assembly factor BamB